MIRLSRAVACLLAVLAPVCAYSNPLAFSYLRIPSPLQAAGPNSALYGTITVLGGPSLPLDDAIASGAAPDAVALTFALPDTRLVYDVVLESMIPNSRPEWPPTITTAALQDFGILQDPFAFQGLILDEVSLERHDHQGDSGGVSGMDQRRQMMMAAEPGTLCVAGLSFTMVALTIRRSRQVLSRRQHKLAGRSQRHRVRLVRQE